MLVRFLLSLFLLVQPPLLKNFSVPGGKNTLSFFIWLLLLFVPLVVPLVVLGDPESDDATQKAVDTARTVAGNLPDGATLAHLGKGSGTGQKQKQAGYLAQAM